MAELDFIDEFLNLGGDIQQDNDVPSTDPQAINTGTNLDFDAGIENNQFFQGLNEQQLSDNANLGSFFDTINEDGSPVETADAGNTGEGFDFNNVLTGVKAFTGLANAYYGSQALGLAKDAFKEDKFQKNRDFAARRTDFNNNTSARNAQNASFGLASRRQLIS